jgi:hypothetical protein
MAADRRFCTKAGMRTMHPALCIPGGVTVDSDEVRKPSRLGRVAEERR